jgi:phosphopantothenate-cysteine ligase
MNLVVTAGGTLAPIDDVRAITNASTGRTGAMITEAALRKGCRVWHLASPLAERPFTRLATFDLATENPEAEFHRLEALRGEFQSQSDRLHPVDLNPGTVANYAEALERTLRSHPIDVAFLAMAASDFAPSPVAGKIRSDLETLTIECQRLPKVITQVRDWSPTSYLVGFKLLVNVSTAELIERAREACLENRADVTVANDLRTVREGRHVLHLVRPGRPVETLEPGKDLAERLVERVLTWARS